MMIAVYGNSYKTTTAVNLTTLLARYNPKSDVILVSLDKAMPILPIIFPNRKEMASLGKLMSSPDAISSGTVLAYTQTCNSYLGVLGYAQGENALSYAAPLPQRIDDFLITLKSNYDYVVIDCTDDIRSKFTAKALIHADKVMMCVSCDIFGANWYSSQHSLMQNVQYRYNEKFLKILTQNSFAGDETVMKRLLGDKIDGNIPYSKVAMRIINEAQAFGAIDDKKYRTSLCDIMSQFATVGKDENSDPFYQPTDYVDSFEIGIDEDDFIEAATDFLSNVSENDNAIIADSGITVEQLFKSIVDIDVEKEKPLSFEQRLYNKLYEFAAPVLNGSAYYMCLESAGYEKLVVENIGGEYSIAHYYQQNGDAMRDPEITFTIKGNAVEPTSFFQDNMKCYYTCDECSKKDINDLKSFMKTWFNNITQQGYAATKVEYYEQTEALDSEIEVRHNVAVAEVAELVTPSDYAAAFGIDEAILNRLVGLHLNESNINEFGRYDELRKTVDKSKAKAYFDRLDNADTPLHKVNMRLDKLLREFIIDADNVAESGQREEQTGVNDDLIDTDVANIGQLTLFENATLSKKQLERLNELSDHIKTEFEHWKSIFINGSTDRMYADGVGLELTRNHIIYYKHLLSEEFPNNLPAIYEKPLPPDISNNYCALDIGDKIMYEDRLFRVESISEESNLEMRSVSLFDIEMSKVYPISRACSLVDLKGRYENLTKEAKYDELMKQLTPVATADYETVREQEIEKEDKEPRYEVEYTSDAFSDKDDVFCVRDTINDELVTDIDDKVVTFSADEEDTADEYCDKLNSENDEVRHNVAVATEEDAQEVRHNVAVEAAHNYRWDGENIYSTGPKAKFTDNINAIKMLYKLENEKRNATPEEQLVLAKYVGWGGLAKAFDETETAWSKEYNELKALLPKREYNAAMESTLTAYYTDPNIAVAMWNTIKQLGFTGGKILEPSCATGNFLSTIPADIADNSDITGVEIDHITGRIAKKLFPNADIQVRGFESTHFENETFDVIIGNVPFGNFDVHDSAYKDDMLIHDYFFIKSLDKVKDGGIVAFITSTGTLDKYSTTIREQLAGKAELLNAVRLPNNAFSAIAGTQTATDIIILQKNINAVEMRDKSPDWTLPMQKELKSTLQLIRNTQTTVYVLMERFIQA